MVLAELTSYCSAWPLVATVLLVVVARKITTYNRLSAFNGPPGVGWTNFFHSRAMFQERCHEWYRDVNQQYGPIARVAPNILITSSADVWTHVNSKPGYRRSDWYYHGARIEYRRDNVFTQTDEAKHTARRKQMAPGYSGRENADLEGAVDEHVRAFLRLVRTRYTSSSSRRPGEPTTTMPAGVVPMDLARKVQYFTLDVISAVGLGRPFGMLPADADVLGYVASSETGLSSLNAAMALGLGWLGQAPLGIGRLFVPSAAEGEGEGEGAATDGFARMLAACNRAVDARAADPTDQRSDMLASFIRHGIRGADLRSEAAEQVLAGSDTTSAAIRGALLHLTTNPRVWAKLRSEVDEAAAAMCGGSGDREESSAGGDGGISDDAHDAAADDPVVPYSTAKSLPYLQAVIREAMRVWVPVLNIFSRDVPEGGDWFRVKVRGGAGPEGEEEEAVFLPGGACIGYSGLAMHRDPAVYGADAACFRPERWLEAEADPARLAAMVRVNDLVFGHGRWHCLGKPVAQLELSKLIFEIVRNFDMTPLNPEKPWKSRNVMGLFIISDMWVQVHERTR